MFKFLTRIEPVSWEIGLKLNFLMVVDRVSTFFQPSNTIKDIEIKDVLVQKFLIKEENSTNWNGKGGTGKFNKNMEKSQYQSSKQKEIDSVYESEL